MPHIILLNKTNHQAVMLLDDILVGDYQYNEDEFFVSVLILNIFKLEVCKL